MLCPLCMREKHRGSCKDNALKVAFEDPTPYRQPRCPICNRDHRKRQECPLRGVDEETQYAAKVNAMRRGR